MCQSPPEVLLFYRLPSPLTDYVVNSRTFLAPDRVQIEFRAANGAIREDGAQQDDIRHGRGGQCEGRGGVGWLLLPWFRRRVDMRLSLVTQFALFLAKKRMQHSGALVCIVSMGFAPVAVGQEKPMSLGVVDVYTTCTARDTVCIPIGRGRDGAAQRRCSGRVGGVRCVYRSLVLSSMISSVVHARVCFRVIPLRGQV